MLLTDKNTELSTAIAFGRIIRPMKCTRVSISHFEIRLILNESSGDERLKRTKKVHKKWIRDGSNLIGI